MSMKHLARPLLLSITLAMAGMPFAALQAAEYPDRSVRIVVPFPPGGTADIVARAISDQMGERLGQPIIVENKPGGAGGSVGTIEIARAEPDGYTIGIATVGTLGTAPATWPRPLYDPMQDFSYITNIADMPMLLAAGPSMKQSTLADVIDEAKREPGQLSFATGGIGGVAHLMGAKFEAATGTRMTHVPYRGASPALNDVAGGQVDLVFDALASSAALLQGGRIRALAVSGEDRVASLPDAPTFAELRLSEVSTQAWYGLIGPAGLDPAVLQRLHDAAAAALATPQVQERLGKLDIRPIGNTPDAYRAQVTEELARWKAIAASQNIVVN